MKSHVGMMTKACVNVLLKITAGGIGAAPRIAKPGQRLGYSISVCAFFRYLDLAM